jgi:hypothetical protein
MESVCYSLSDFVQPNGARDSKHRETWERFYREALLAIERTDSIQLRNWMLQSVGQTVQLMGSRANRLFELIGCVARGAWREFKELFRAICCGQLTPYMKNLCRRLWVNLKGLIAKIGNAFTNARDFVASLTRADSREIIDLTMAFVGSVVGFVLIGGAGDGGLIDADIAVLGLGGHRSLWFHSIFIGIAAESSFMSFFALQRLLHGNLPDDHQPLWDRLLMLSERFHAGLIRGCWVGVTTHLAMDSHIDGWTPYKDLPIALPSYAHHLVMDLNAAAAGWFAWQWHDKIKRHFRDNSFYPAREVSKSGAVVNLPSLEAVELDSRPQALG